MTQVESHYPGTSTISCLFASISAWLLYVGFSQTNQTNVFANRKGVVNVCYDGQLLVLLYMGEYIARIYTPCKQQRWQ